MNFYASVRNSLLMAGKRINLYYWKVHVQWTSGLVGLGCFGEATIMYNDWCNSPDIFIHQWHDVLYLLEQFLLDLQCQSMG